MLQPNTFPNVTELTRISTLRNYEKLYMNDQMSVLGLHELIKKQFKKTSDLIYLSHAIPARVSDFYGDFVAGDTEKMVITAGTENDQDEEFVDAIVYNNDLKEKISDIGTEQSEFGFAPLLGYLDEAGDYIIELIPQDQYFPQSDNSVVVATYRVDTRGTDSKKFVLLTKHYYLVGEDLFIDRQAWNCDEKGVAVSPVELSVMASIMGKVSIEPVTKIVGLGDIPIRQVDNTNRNKWGFGKSDYADIIPNLAEINERTSHVAVQLLKNLDAKMQLPSNLFNEDGSVKPFENIAVDSKDSPDSKYITNSNTLMTEAGDHILRELKFISMVTAVPMFELLRTSTPETVEGMRMNMFSAIRKTNRKRSRVKRALNDLIRIGFKMSGKALEQDINFVFSDVLPTNELQNAETESVKVTAGVTSKRSSIMRLEGVDESDAEEELKRIEQENRISGIGDVVPVLDPNAKDIKDKIGA